jgi:uncharacterized protein YdcH (DUF465 family)
MSSPLSDLSDLRSRDPSFDALCEDYETLDTHVASLSARLGALGSVELERLKRRRAYVANLIQFVAGGLRAA